MESTLPPPVTEAQTYSMAVEMTKNDAGLSGFVEQEESSIMESPKKDSSKWTDEKHSVYLKSMEACFVDQLYNSLDIRSSGTQNECSSDIVSSRRLQHNSGQFKVLQHGSWSRINFRKENSAVKEVDRPHVSSRNPWIKHFRTGSKYGAPQSPLTKEKPPVTSCSNEEVTDQNFVQEDSPVQKVNTTCSKKRKNTSAVSESGNNQAASFWHFSYNGNR